MAARICKSTGIKSVVVEESHSSPRDRNDGRTSSRDNNGFTLAGIKCDPRVPFGAEGSFRKAKRHSTGEEISPCVLDRAVAGTAAISMALQRVPLCSLFQTNREHKASCFAVQFSMKLNDR